MTRLIKGQFIINIGLYPNPSRDIGFKCAARLARYLIGKGCRVLAEHDLGQDGTELTSDVFLQSDVVVVLGGDGTMLRAADRAAERDLPLLGINLGNLGYLTDSEDAGAEQSLLRLLAGKYVKERRMRLICRDQDGAEIATALNDFCYTRMRPAKLCDFELRINGEYIDTVRCDGVIVSTPTGSTAYNVAAGGPILKPDARMIVVTPVCAFNLYSRPLVVSETDVVSVGNRSDGEGLLLSGDGEELRELPRGQSFTVTASKRDTTILKTTGQNFYDIVRKKLMW